jgi:hypothetical protein
MGSALCVSPSTLDRGHPTRSRRAAPAAPPTSRTRGGFWKGGGPPPLPDERENLFEYL